MIPQRRGAHDATIARLEIRADGADSLAARQCVERLLGAMELRPDSLPPPAILCVRELRDPRPGTISLASRQLWPPPMWEQAMRHEVERLARAAARPAHGAAPAAAEAVVFADESELLACLGSDLVAGMVGARWWWRLLVEGIGQPRHGTVRAWLRAPEHVPAALQVLAERREAEAFVRILDDRDARELAAEIAKTFGLPAVATDTDIVRGSGPAIAALARLRVSTEAAAASPEVDRASASTEPHAVEAPWSAIVPEAERAGLSIEQRALLGVALTIARAPSLARSTEFAIELAAWREISSLPRPGVATTWERARGSVPATASLEPASTPRLDRAAAATMWQVVPFSADETVVRQLTPGTLQDTKPTAGVAIPPIDPAPSTPRSSESLSPPPSPAIDAVVHTADEQPTTWPQLPDDPHAAAEPSRRSPVVSRKPPATRPRSRAFGPPIQTRLGGLFYLVNLALYLRLYGDDGENLPLPLWDFVALVGRALLGDDAVIDDPVWALLAELAGRAHGEPTGAGFVPPADWRLPPAWLAAFEAEPARHWLSNGRLVISHAEGFAIVDVPAVGDHAAQLATELAPYGVAGSTADAPPLALPDAPLDRWLAWLVPYLRARLRRVLAVDDAGLPALLLAHPARVHVTATHLDVVLPLETLSIEIRIAGLDRDPGWVAAAGRFIAFHFE